FDNSLTMLPGVVRPLSRGWIRLASGNPMDPPLINPNYLGAQADCDRLVQGIKLARQIYATEPLKSWVAAVVFPGDDIATDEQIEGFVRQFADSYHHQAGSCRMGMDSMAVVDPK